MHKKKLDHVVQVSNVEIAEAKGVYVLKNTKCVIMTSNLMLFSAYFSVILVMV
jgi:hypothetical protein